MTSITEDLGFVGIDDEGYAQAVAAAKSFQYGDDQSGFAFTGKATLMFQREAPEWEHGAFSSTAIITFIDPIQGAPDDQGAEDAQDEEFLAAVSERVSFLHIPAQCQDMQVDDVWGIDCEFLMFAMPHPHDESASAWLLIPGPHHRVVSSRNTVQDYQMAEIKRAAAELGLDGGEEPQLH
ncbi:MAG: hypothetical protein ABWY08_19045 [Comamonas sp.]